MKIRYRNLILAVLLAPCLLEASTSSRVIPLQCESTTESIGISKSNCSCELIRVNRLDSPLPDGSDLVRNIYDHHPQLDPDHIRLELAFSTDPSTEIIFAQDIEKLCCEGGSELTFTGPHYLEHSLIYFEVIYSCDAEAYTMQVFYNLTGDHWTVDEERTNATVNWPFLP